MINPVAGLAAGLASESKFSSHFSRGDPSGRDSRGRAAPVTVVALDQQQLGK